MPTSNSITDSSDEGIDCRAHSNDWKGVQTEAAWAEAEYKPGFACPGRRPSDPDRGDLRLSSRRDSTLASSPNRC